MSRLVSRVLARPLRTLGSASAPTRNSLRHPPTMFRPVRGFRATLARQGTIPFLLTDIGEGIAEVEVLQWFVKEGDHVKQFDKICEVQSDKATVEITSRFDGQITKIHYAANDMAKTGTPLVDISSPDIPDAPPKAAETKKEAPAAEAPPAAAAAADSATKDSFASTNDKVLATPAVRRIARENNIDLRQVTPTGKGGRVMKEDVLQFISGGQQEAAQQSSAPAFAATAEDQVVPIRGMTRLMVKSMTESLAIPHFGYDEEIEVDEMHKFREELKPIAADRGVKFTYMPIFIKAMSLAIKSYPIVNSRINEDGTEILIRGSHNIGVAMDTPAGLAVPVVKDVQAKSLIEVAAELNRLQSLGSEGKLGAEDLSDATISISNVGNIGGTYLRPVIAPPQVAIVALGRIQTLPRYNDEMEVVPKKIVRASWSGDHRVIDGATMARFNDQWMKFLQNPKSMLLEMA